MNVKKLVILLIVSLLIFSCATANVSTTWVDPEYSSPPLKKIVVIGLFRNTNSRREFENEAAKRINANSGTKAVSSLSFMPPDVKYEPKNMEKLFNEMGIDGILILRTKSIEDQSRYIPGKSYTVTRAYPMYYYNYPFYQKYYRYTYETIHEPGYYKNTYIVCTESTLFKNSNDKMVWMMEKNTTQSYKTVDGITNPKAEAVRTAGLIYKDLKINGLLLNK